MRITCCLLLSLLAMPVFAADAVSGSGYPNPPEVYTLKLSVSGQNCSPTLCKDDPGFAQDFPLSLTLDQCSDDPGEYYGKNCFGSSQIVEKEFSDSSGKFTYSVSISRLYGTSVSPNYKPLGYDFQFLMDMCYVPASDQTGKGYCARTTQLFNTASELNFFNSFDSPPDANGTNHSGYASVSKN